MSALPDPDYKALWRDSMRRRAQIETLLDDVLGDEDIDGAGEGIVADVALALKVAEERGAARVRERVEAIIDALRTSAADSLIGSPNKRPVVGAIILADQLRAALGGGGA